MDVDQCDRTELSSSSYIFSFRLGFLMEVVTSCTEYERIRDNSVGELLTFLLLPQILKNRPHRRLFIYFLAHFPYFEK
jgi:hypothetical protein